MNELEKDVSNRTDDALEQLLRQASPRPMPSSHNTAAAKQAVRAEWRNVTSRYRARRRLVTYAAAATVLLGVFAIFNTFRATAVQSDQVASIEKSFGTIYLLADSAELREARDLATIVTGQTILTGDDAGMALAWSNGGSIRIDENTRIEFTTDDRIFLRSGRVYFDSAPSSVMAEIPSDGTSKFLVRTEYGDVVHVGTQFMAEVNRESLSVSVREGQVAIDGRFHDRVAAAGKQVTLTGRQAPTVLDIDRSGEHWAWVERTTPPADVDGRSLHEFLRWACRELGLELRYEGSAESVAQKAILKGSIDKQPADALRLRLASAALNWRVDEERGVIYVSDSQ